MTTAALHATRQPIRVLIVEPSTFQREGVHAWLRPYADMQVIGAATSTADACRIARQAQPDVVVINVDNDSAAVSRELHRYVGKARVLIILNSMEQRNAIHSPRAVGADELLFGSIRPHMVVEAIRRISPDHT